MFRHGVRLHVPYFSFVATKIESNSPQKLKNQHYQPGPNSLLYVISDMFKSYCDSESVSSVMFNLLELKDYISSSPLAPKPNLSSKFV